MSNRPTTVEVAPSYHKPDRRAAEEKDSEVVE